MNKIKGISFFCPAYYDAENLPSVIETCVKVFSETCEDYEIIIISDGSPDDTGKVADSLQAKYKEVKVIHHPRNLGYAEALRSGFKNASKFDFILFTDGDNQYDVQYFREMLKYMNDYDVIITYRTKNANNLIRKIISYTFNRVLNILFREPFRDLSSALRMVRRSSFKSIYLRSKSIFLPVEIILKLYKNGFRVKELPIESKKREHGKSSSLLPKNFIGLVKDMLSIWKKDFLNAKSK